MLAQICLSSVSYFTVSRGGGPEYDVFACYLILGLLYCEPGPVGTLPTLASPLELAGTV
jgi:hypothetical protein